MRSLARAGAKSAVRLVKRYPLIDYGRLFWFLFHTMLRSFRLDGWLGCRWKLADGSKWVRSIAPGVGKTETCNVFTDYLPASEKLVRFDRSE